MPTQRALSPFAFYLGLADVSIFNNSCVFKLLIYITYIYLFINIHISHF